MIPNDTNSSGRILLLVSHNARGGAQELFCNIRDEMIALGFDVDIYALYRNNSESDCFDEINCITEPARSVFKPFLAFKILTTLRSLLVKQKYAAIFSALPPANIFAAVACTLQQNETRVVTTHHSPASTHGTIMRIIDSITGRLPKVTAIISVSKEVARSFAPNGTQYCEKMQVVHNALPVKLEAEIDVFSTLAAKAPLHRKALIATGRLVPQKNYETLLKAMSLLEDHTLEICGDGPLRAQLQRLSAELRLSGRVFFRGQKTRSETIIAMSRSGIFVQPSLYEGHSLALLEAARLGMPLVVSDAATQIEGISSSEGSLFGLVAPVRDHEAFANTIRLLSENANTFLHYKDLALQLAKTHSFSALTREYLRVAMLRRSDQLILR